MQLPTQFLSERNPFLFVPPLGARKGVLPTVVGDRLGAPRLHHTAPYADLQTWIRFRPMADAIIAMTGELFPGPIRIETDVDPEFPDNERFVVEVEAHGEFREILDRELRWHDRLWELVGKTAGLQFGICIFPK